MTQDPTTKGLRGRRLQPIVLIAIGVVLLLVLAGAGYGLYRLLNPTCGPDVADLDGQCIGVTDGSVDLSRGTDRGLAAVLATIAQQNQDVVRESQAGGRTSVSVAYLLPLPPPDGDSIAKLPQPALVDELRGAAAAQRFANGPNAGAQPRVRLLVANDGYGATHADEVVPMLTAMTDPAGDDRLVALNESYEPGAGPRDMDKVMRNVCAQRPDVVLFAGRTPELLTFVEAYSRAACQGHPLNVLTGSDAIDFAGALAAAANEPVRARLMDGATVYYSALADARAWQGRPDAFDPRGRDPLRGFGPLNAASIMGSDTVTFASDAIADASSPGRPPPVADQVRLALQRFNGVNADDLASGWLAVDSRTGLAVNKATPILQVLPGGGDEFFRLSSTAGTPCIPTTGNCFASPR